MRCVLCISVIWCCLVSLDVEAGSTKSAANLPADFLSNPDVVRYLDRLSTEQGQDRQYLESLFAPLTPSQSVIDRISKPAERTLKWFEYRRIFISDKRIEAGRAFAEEHRLWLERAEERYGVPIDLIVAIIGVETYFGRYSGKDNVLTALATLAFHYPRRAEFFQRELTELILLADEERLDAASLSGSYAGAMGLPQFIASSYRHYAVDFDEDGRRDLWNSTADAIGSVANYFVQHGWRTGEPITERAYPETLAYKKLLSKKRQPAVTLAQLKRAGLTPVRSGKGKMTLMELQQRKIIELWIGHHNFYVITQYNHSKLYAMAVRDLALAIGRARSSTKSGSTK